MYLEVLILSSLIDLDFASDYQQLTDLQYYVYPSRIFESDDHVTMKTHDGIDLNRCIASCERFDFCRAIAVNHTDTATTCRYFDYVSFHSTAISTDPGSYYIAKRKKTQCSINCEKRVCGECKCVDFCYLDKKKRGPRHYLCDCSQTFEAVGSCNDVIASRGEDFIAGLYSIDPDGSGVITVNCVTLNKVHHGKDLQCDFIPNRYGNSGVGHRRLSGSSHSEEACKRKAFQMCEELQYNVWVWYRGGYCEIFKKASIVPSGDSWWHACEPTFKAQNSTTLNPPKGAILMMLRDGKSVSSVWERPFADYEVGFRDHQNEWIGLEKLAKISEAFHTDIQVDVLDSVTSEMFTTFYRDVAITKDSSHTLTYSSFEAEGVSTMAYYHLPQLGSGAQFGTCSDDAEWFCRTSGFKNYNPTSMDNFGFGDYKTVQSIAFYVITKTKK